MNRVGIIPHSHGSQDNGRTVNGREYALSTQFGNKMATVIRERSITLSGPRTSFSVDVNAEIETERRSHTSTSANISYSLVDGPTHVERCFNSE